MFCSMSFKVSQILCSSFNPLFFPFFKLDYFVLSCKVFFKHIFYKWVLWFIFCIWVYRMYIFSIYILYMVSACLTYMQSTSC